MTYFRVNNESKAPGIREAATDARTIISAFAALLGIFALWILIPELTGPQLSYFPSNPDEANAMYAARDSATAAAEMGMVRGDLWTIAAVTAIAPSLFGTTDSSPKQPVEVEAMRAIADRAARLSPYDSRIWLVLAALDFQVDRDDPKGTEALKLSYYTGPNEISLMPVRLLLAVRSSAISDDEVQSLVPMDVQHIAQRPDLKPSIALAYTKALPKGREIIEAALKDTDPSFLKTITAPRSGTQIPN